MLRDIRYGRPNEAVQGWRMEIRGEGRVIWRAMRDSDENYIYSIALYGPPK